MTKMTALEAATSSFASVDVSRTAFCKDVPAFDNDSELLFDFMDIAFIRAVSRLPVLRAVKWRSKASMTSLSYDCYRVTNAGPIILLFNGFISESTIPPGATVNIPDISSLKARLSAPNRGKVTRI